MDSPFSSRPSGVKKWKSEDAVEYKGSKVARSVDSMGATLQESADGKKKAASISLQFKIFHRMNLSTSQMKERLERLMTQAARLGGAGKVEGEGYSAEEHLMEPSELIGGTISTDDGHVHGKIPEHRISLVPNAGGGFGF